MASFKYPFWTKAFQLRSDYLHGCFGSFPNHTSRLRIRKTSGFNMEDAKHPSRDDEAFPSHSRPRNL
ncbi:hypothetical protein AJ78_08993 [Emergomyces pasteurianus Ep9510]|uniref:Uncharacterized protein n=1 Tax=Emergomyces pasteurianus Ep9510 TaxID=1447872 RepID=A0A1J9Q3B8_9EURO|nr:hypothetical protein AJ78_08993 [Emergomyces pasteurianus Ep9510]